VLRTYNSVNYFFCNIGRAKTFDAGPERYASGAGVGHA
jgi:YHS domain-containing protein